MSKGLNIDAIRELNKIKVYAVKNTVQENNDADIFLSAGSSPYMKRIFSAYLTEPVGNFGTGSMQTSSLTQEIGNAIGKIDFVEKFGLSKLGEGVVKTVENAIGGKSSAWANFAGQATDLSNVLNYNYKYRFTGISEFSKTINCELVAKNDIFIDVIKPLWSLLEYVMPEETKKLEETDFYKEAEDAIKKWYDNVKTYVQTKTSDIINQDFLDMLWKGAENLGMTADAITGGLSFLKIPEQLKPENKFTRIIIGNYIVIDDVIIESVGFNLPYLLYEGGLFDRVTVTLKIKGCRKMSLKTYDWLRQLSQEDSTSYNTDKYTQKSLNYLYNKDVDTPPSSATNTSKSL